MDKNTLKTVLAGLVANQEVEVNFHPGVTSKSGKYRVTESKVDRGKMGSRKVTMVSVDDNSAAEMHTKNNTDVVSVVVNGQMFGTEDAEEVRVYPRDQTRGQEFQQLFKSIVAGQKVQVNSLMEPSWVGEYKVVASKPSRGKVSQQTLHLARDGKMLVLASYRHSLALTSVVVLNDDSNTPASV